MAVIVSPRPVDPCSADLIQRWQTIPVAIVVDVSHGACQIDPAIRPLCPPGQQPRLFGRAVTALCMPPDFGAVLYALDQLQTGDVLLIAAAGNTNCAMIGEILGGHVRRRGAVGIVCDGAIRDVAQLAKWNDLSVFARSINPRGPSSYQFGMVNQPVVIGGKLIHPGDLVIGDDDGLAALHPKAIATYIDAAEAKVQLEEQWLSSLSQGQSVGQTFGLAED